MNKDDYIVIDGRESLKESIYKDVVSTCFLSFLIFISRGSTFWTFICGAIFLLFAISWLSRQFKIRKHRFSNITQLRQWVESEIMKEKINKDNYTC